MAIKLQNTDNPYTLQRIAITGNVINLQLRWSDRTQVWYLDVLSGDGVTPILGGLKVMPNQNLTGRYSATALRGGDFWCLRVKNQSGPITKTNFGLNGDYALYWVSDQEAEELGVDGQITIR